MVVGRLLNEMAAKPKNTAQDCVKPLNVEFVLPSCVSLTFF